MTFEDINKRLEELSKEIPVALKVLNELEQNYNKKYYYTLIHSGMGNAQAREAEAIILCTEEGLYEPFINQKTEIRSLYQEKECLIEIAKNMRMMKGGEL